MGNTFLHVHQLNRNTFQDSIGQQRHFFYPACESVKTVLEFHGYNRNLFSILDLFSRLYSNGFPIFPTVFVLLE